MQHRRVWRSWTVAVALALAACGPGGSSGGASGSATPTPSRTPSPTETISVEPTPVPAIAAMELGERGYALSVNRDGWISTREDTATSVIGYTSGLTWAPDAMRPSGLPLPTLPCDGLPPGACFHQFDILLEVGDDGWIFGDHVTFGSGGPFIPLPALYGPERRWFLLIDPQHPPLDLDAVAGFEGHLCAAAQLAGTLLLREDGAASPVRRPVLWRAPDETMLRLPSAAAGAAATSCDRSLRVAGVADAPTRAVVWVPGDPAGYAQVELPAAGSDASAALAIDPGQIVGWWSDGARSTPVAWTAADGGFASFVLPDLPAARCERATATSGTRIAGDCGASAVAWHRAADGDGWQLAAELLPLPGDARAHVVALSGDLAVGWSGEGDGDGRKRPVAWRLPPAP